MANFPTLNQNKAFSALYNAYRLMSSIGDNLAGLDLSNASKYKIDGGHYEDQLVWTYSDILASYPFDPESGVASARAAGTVASSMNVLVPGQAAIVSQQNMVVDKIRQISLYIPANFLTKQAWQNPSFFDAFMSIVESQVINTRKLYDQRLVDTYIGTTVSTTGAQYQTITLSGTNDALHIAEAMANIADQLKDSTRDYNDKGYMVATPESDIDIYVSSTWNNKITKLNLPSIFHKDGLFRGMKSLPARYFGFPITTTNYSTYSASTPAAGKPIDSDTGVYTPGANHANGILRALAEVDVTVNGTTTHVFPGDELPSGAVVYASSAVAIPCYIESDKIIAKIIHKDAIKYVSAVETETEFFNAKNHSRNKYLTFMYGGPDRLAIRPFVTLSKA